MFKLRQLRSQESSIYRETYYPSENLNHLPLRQETNDLTI